MRKLSELDKYIEELKIKTKDFTELEKIRYVYIDMGKKFTFDLNFSFGNKNQKQKIYKSCINNKDNLEESFKSKIIICKSLSYLLEYILKSLGIKIITYSIPNDYSKDCIHVLNIIHLQDGRRLSIDLQSDLEMIQSRRRTKYFGVPIHEEYSGITRKELETIDLKMGYISKNQYYSDDYRYLMDTIIPYFNKLEEKLDFLLSNFDIYDSSKNMQYAEMRWYIVNQIREYLTEKEYRKIHILDLYFDKEDTRDYTICFIVDVPIYRIIYIYSPISKSFEKISIEDFQEKLQSGWKSHEKIPRLQRKILTINR